MRPKIIFRSKERLKERRVDEKTLAAEVSGLAQSSGKWQTRAIHGGEDKDYWKRSGKTPLTEVALAISDPLGLTVVWIGTCDAFAVTERKIASTVLTDYELRPALDLYDRRVKRSERLEKARESLKQAHDRAFSPMEQLAAAAD